jgi:hypothetical protein
MHFYYGAPPKFERAGWNRTAYKSASYIPDSTVIAFKDVMLIKCIVLLEHGASESAMYEKSNISIICRRIIGKHY